MTEPMRLTAFVYRCGPNQYKFRSLQITGGPPHVRADFPDGETYHQASHELITLLAERGYESTTSTEYVDISPLHFADVIHD